MKQSARWALTVSDDVNRRVRRYLASAGRQGDLSAFVEEAVPTYSRPSANDMEQPDVGTSDELKGGSYGG